MAVRKAVIGLNLLGVKTTSCCGGHRDFRPLQGPFIGFEDPTDNDAHFGEFHSNHFIELGNTTDNSSSVSAYLDEFYSDRKVDEESRLVNQQGVIYNRGNKDRVFTYNDPIWGPQRPSRRVGRLELRRYQRQMKDLGTFLEEKYYSSPQPPSDVDSF